MKLLSTITFKYSFLHLSKTSFNALSKKEIPQQFTQLSANQSIETLAQIIANLRRKELKYLDWRYKQQAMKTGKSLFEVSLNRQNVDEAIDSRSYFIQQNYNEQQWGEPNSLTNFIYKGGSKSGGAGQDVQQVKKKDIYDVELSTVNAADKIKIIKVIRQTLNLGLKQAKELVEKTPVVLKQAKKEQADELAAKLTAAGCNITVK